MSACKVVAGALLAQGKTVRVVTRTGDATAQPWKDKGAEVAVADVEDRTALERVVQLAGPREYSPRDVAVAFARVVGKPVVAQQQPEESMAPALLAAGMTPEWSRLFQELTHGVNSGRVAWEDGHSMWRGETDMEAVLAPLVGGE